MSPFKSTAQADMEPLCTASSADQRDGTRNPDESHMHDESCESLLCAVREFSAEKGDYCTFFEVGDFQYCFRVPPRIPVKV